ncbi:MAG: CPBP family intramembrane metalloprotease [Ignavibacteria bacterium]|nr:CPBP family intramembrane metalloprotease [Ignavibacteria bacterium]
MPSQVPAYELNQGTQHSILLSITLHLFPGALATALYVILAPKLNLLGLPSILTFLVIAVLVVIPIELSVLFVAGYRLQKKISLDKVISYREPLPRSQYLILVPSLLIWAIIGYTAVAAPIDALMLKHLFSWFPDQLRLDEIITNLSNYSENTLILTLVIGFLVNGLLGPIVEELYFRGYLLPCISRFGKWAPLLNTTLFSIYHFFTPWQLFSRIVGLLPLYYVVWWKKNIYIGIWVHCLMNSIATIFMALAVMI